MRIFLALILLVISNVALATTIDCYSSGKLIYHGIRKDVFYLDQGYFFVRDKRNHQEHLIFTNDCVVKL